MWAWIKMSHRLVAGLGVCRRAPGRVRVGRRLGRGRPFWKDSRSLRSEPAPDREERLVRSPEPTLTADVDEAGRVDVIVVVLPRPCDEATADRGGRRIDDRQI